jgi:predicted unusual protein kinase regulating ubiquinone biosynthesis (AarF/ABC1/UbiB family)
VCDLGALHDIAEFMDAHTEIGERYRLVDTLDEFRLSLAKELDYRQEARHLIEIGENLKSFPNIIIPQPVENYSSSKVLTMDYVRGRKITTLGPLTHLEMNGGLLAEELFQAYLKQILVDGVFHADPHPGNVFITNDYQIALIDLGMIGRLTPNMQEQLLKLLLAISEMRSDEAADIGLKMGEKNRFAKEAFNELQFRHRLAQIFDARLSGNLADMQIGMALMDYARVCSESGIIMPAELTMLGKTLLNLDDIGRTLDPGFDPNASIRRNAMSVTQSRIGKSLSPAALLSTAMEAKEFAQELPGRINKILDSIAKNQLTVQVDAIEEETLVEGFQKVANRITTGVVLAALIIGAALLMRIDTPFKLFGYPGLAMLCFLVAAMGGFWLLVEIAVKDRQSRKKS